MLFCRRWARQSVEDGAMPFTVHFLLTDTKRAFSFANGRYKIPEGIEESKKEILQMFEGKMEEMEEKGRQGERT